jgi:FKBP-type peptidyl-prolyl cis-trans isomerase FklB
LIAIAGAGFVAVVGVVLARSRANASATRRLDTPKKKLSYALGVAMARNFNRPAFELDRDVLASGLTDGFSGHDLLLAEDALRETISAFQGELKQKQAQAVKSAAEINKNEGEAFLGQNARGEGVETLPSGLQYKVLSAGDGKRPTDRDTVECRYRGTRIDGREFQSSDAAAHSATFPVGAAIPGWKEALKLMPIGSKWKLFVPPQLAYGERGSPVRKRGGRAIGPNETVIFELELLAIKPPAGAPEQSAVQASPDED